MASEALCNAQDVSLLNNFRGTMMLLKNTKRIMQSAAIRLPQMSRWLLR